MPYVRATKNNYLRNTTNRYKSGIAVTVLNVQQCLHSATANLCNICLIFMQYKLYKIKIIYNISIKKYLSIYCSQVRFFEIFVLKSILLQKCPMCKRNIL